MRFEEILSRFPDAKKSGDGWTAKCPAHKDGTASLSISEGSDGRTLLKCHAGCTPDAICSSLGLSLKDLFLRNGQQNGKILARKTTVSAFDWLAACRDTTPEHLQKLAAWRGYSLEFCQWLHGQKLIGVMDGNFAFPNHDAQGQVVSAHVRRESGTWIFKPTGQKTAPLIFGNAKSATYILAFESQFDAFAVTDKLGWHTGNVLTDSAVFITRGAGNGKLIRGQIAPDAVCYAFKQNDAPTAKNPIPAGDVWLADVASNAGCKVLNVSTPASHADVNDWTRAGASETEPATDTVC